MDDKERIAVFRRWTSHKSMNGRMKMTDQLTVVNEQPTLSSLEVAEMIGKKEGLNMDNRKTTLTERE